MSHYMWLIFALFALIVGNTEKTSSDVSLDMQNVYEVSLKLGGEKLAHIANENMEGVSAKKGEELFLTGRTIGPNGKKTSRQSKHFVCTSCHNIQKEDPNLATPNPEDRLAFAKANDLPFLQGTTMHGVVNRRTFYNGDYYKKYGEDIAEKVREDLRESIQLCATGCAQGREMEDWEIESVLAYFWTLQLKLSDLNLTEGQRDIVESALTGKADKAEALNAINSAYLDYSPATFETPPPNRVEGYAEKGNPENGKDIYELSCLHCHENGRYSYYSLDHSKFSYKHLRKHFPKFSPYSSYQLIRYGTQPWAGDKFYMPQYTLERMSNKQVEDLRAFLENK